MLATIVTVEENCAPILMQEMPSLFKLAICNLRDTSKYVWSNESTECYYDNLPQVNVNYTEDDEVGINRNDSNCRLISDSTPTFSII